MVVREILPRIAPPSEIGDHRHAVDMDDQIPHVVLVMHFVVVTTFSREHQPARISRIDPRDHPLHLRVPVLPRRDGRLVQRGIGPPDQRAQLPREGAVGSLRLSGVLVRQPQQVVQPIMLRQPDQQRHGGRDRGVTVGKIHKAPWAEDRAQRKGGDLAHDCFAEKIHAPVGAPVDEVRRQDVIAEAEIPIGRSLGAAPLGVERRQVVVERARAPRDNLPQPGGVLLQVDRRRDHVADTHPGPVVELAPRIRVQPPEIMPRQKRRQDAAVHLVADAPGQQGMAAIPQQQHDFGQLGRRQRREQPDFGPVHVGQIVMVGGKFPTAFFADRPGDRQQRVQEAALIFQAFGQRQVGQHLPPLKPGRLVGLAFAAAKEFKEQRGGQRRHGLRGSRLGSSDHGPAAIRP